MSSDRDRPFYPGKHETGRCSTPCRGLDAVVKRADSGHFTGELARAALFAEESEHTASEPRRTHPELLGFQPNTHSVDCDAGAFHRMVTNLDVATGERAVAVEHWYRHRTSIENVFRDAKLRAALRHLPSGYPQVNTAWTWGALLAASIAGWLHQLTATRSGRPAVRPRHRPAMIATLQHRLIRVPARLVRHGGALTLRLPPGRKTRAAKPPQREGRVASSDTVQRLSDGTGLDHRVQASARSPARGRTLPVQRRTCRHPAG